MKNKYHAKKVIVNGIKFDSKKEAKRYSLLRMLEKGGVIKDLKLQPEFLLQDEFKGILNNKLQTFRKITYKADFSYFDIKKNKVVVEDVKGFKNPVYLLKRKMLLKMYPQINFFEV